MSTVEQTATSNTYRWTFSNAISVLRIVLALPAWIAFEAGLRGTVVAIAIFAVITDLLDGYIARRYNEISDLGKILDPLADKVFAATAVLVLVAHGELPLWFVFVVLGRDLIIFAGGTWIERRTGLVVASNYPGKAAALTLAVTLMLIVARVPHGVTDVLLGISLLLLAVSLVLYVVRGVRALRGAEADASTSSTAERTKGTADVSE